MEQLGINLTSLIAQIINFAILYFVLKKFVFDSIVKMVQEQRKKKKDIEVKSKQIEKEYQSLEQKKEKELARTQKQTTELIAEARKEAEAVRKEVLDKANSEAKKIQENAKLELKQQEQEMKENVQDYTASLAVKMASQLIGKYLGKKEQEQLVNQSIKALNKTKL